MFSCIALVCAPSQGPDRCPFGKTNPVYPLRCDPIHAHLSLLLLPACVWTTSHLLGLESDWTAALVLISAVPTGVNAWLIANRFGVGHSLAASTITLTTALGAITVSFWAYLLG